MVFRLAVLVVYGYVIGLSLWATRVQRRAAMTAHHPRDHLAMSHIRERDLHGDIARTLLASLGVRMAQLTFDVPRWLLITLTIAVALWTLLSLSIVWRMAKEDFYSWNVFGLNRAKTVLLLICTFALFLDQIWRVVTLFWP